MLKWRFLPLFMLFALELFVLFQLGLVAVMFFSVVFFLGLVLLVFGRGCGGVCGGHDCLLLYKVSQVLSRNM